MIKRYQRAFANSHTLSLLQQDTASGEKPPNELRCVSAVRAYDEKYTNGWESRFFIPTGKVALIRFTPRGDKASLVIVRP